MTMRPLLGFGSLGLALVATTLGCGAAATDAELGAEEAIESRGDAFEVKDGLYLNLMSRAHSTIRVCLRGDGLNNQNITERQGWVRSAIMEWIDAARPASTEQLLSASDVSFGCINQHATVNWSPVVVEPECSGSTSGCRAHIDSNNNFQMNLFEGNDYGTVLHEFGHLFGLADCYQPGPPEDTKPGQTILQIMAFSGVDHLWPEDAEGISEIYCMNYPDKCARRWERDAHWCDHEGAVLHVGDFNGDEYQDLLCHDRAEGRLWIDRANSSGQFNGTNWTEDVNFCRGQGKIVFVGDFNGDKKDDLLCHYTVTDEIWVSYATPEGEFTDDTWYKDLNVGKSLYIGDFNGDERDDLLWHDAVEGPMKVKLADENGEFDGPSWPFDTDYCARVEADLFIGDFDGDRHDDLLCHDEGTGRIWIKYADSEGHFDSHRWSKDLKWCYGSGDQLHIGDFDGDEQDDMLCHNTTTGTKRIAMAFPDGNFEGTSRYWNPGWCKHSDARLFVGDFDNNGVDDFLCHDVENGKKWVMKQYSGSPF